jgi:hypothetical protein
MKHEKQAISPLLESVIQENPTYKFPIEFIGKELTNMFLEPLEYDYFMIQCYKKLKMEFGETIGHIFLQVSEMKMNTPDRNVYTLTEQEYQSKMDDFLSTLENIYITKVDKNSPDGEMMSAMI